SDWDERLRDWGGLPEMYQPLVDLAEAVFAQQEPVPLVSYLLAKHPHHNNTPPRDNPPTQSKPAAGLSRLYNPVSLTSTNPPAA
ncbi:hypothetical protein, partial [Nocardia wallacei]|uniref:hypothetical protein n=1 Tax=Nocardia wallacei TaxID=480035 RepID=UPI0024590824